MEETIPLLEENVNQISAQLASTGIRGDWKETRENYSRIESSKAIEYSHAVIAAYSIGTTPIHAFSCAICSPPMCMCTPPYPF